MSDIVNDNLGVVFSLPVENWLFGPDLFHKL